MIDSQDIIARMERLQVRYSKDPDLLDLLRLTADMLQYTLRLDTRLMHIEAQQKAPGFW